MKKLNLTIDNLTNSGYRGFCSTITCPDCTHTINVYEFGDNVCDCTEWHLEISVKAVGNKKPFVCK